MYYFEIMNTRKVTPVTSRVYYPIFTILNPTLDEVIQNWYTGKYDSESIANHQKRAAFWKLQGDILGSVSCLS